jgi:hypothetical protein
MEQLTINKSKEKTTALDMWFETTIQELRDDQRDIKLGTAPKEKEDFYNKLMNNNDELSNELRKGISINFLQKALQAYYALISNSEHPPVKIAFDHSDRKLLVFAVIKDDDEEAEDNLLLAAAKINNRFQKFGIYVSTMIIEESDNYPIPPQYTVL